MKDYVFDSSAVLSFLLGQQNSAKVVEVIKAARSGSAIIAMSAVNWGEAYYSIYSKSPENDAEQLRQAVRKLPIVVITVDAERCERAGRIKVRHKLGYADAFAAELAVERNATLVTSDTDFRRVQGQIKILWVNRKA